MSVPFYAFHSLLLKLPNKEIDFPFPPLKLPNKEREEYYKIILFISFHFIPFPPPKQGLKISNFHSSKNWEEWEGVELNLMNFFTKTPKIPLYIQPFVLK